MQSSLLHSASMPIMTSTPLQMLPRPRHCRCCQGDIGRLMWSMTTRCSGRNRTMNILRQTMLNCFSPSSLATQGGGYSHKFVNHTCFDMLNQPRLQYGVYAKHVLHTCMSKHTSSGDSSPLHSLYLHPHVVPFVVFRFPSCNSWFCYNVVNFMGRVCN